MKFLRRLGGTNASCTHQTGPVATPSGDRCESCGSSYSLRMCATCGHVGCCESQAGDARRHALAEGHPVILSMPIGAGFTWCYEDNAYVD